MCRQCRQGTYQDAVGQTSCTACPNGQSTTGEGSDSLSDCKGNECIYRYDSNHKSYGKKISCDNYIRVIRILYAKAANIFVEVDTNKTRNIFKNYSMFIEIKIIVNLGYMANYIMCTS